MMKEYSRATFEATTEETLHPEQKKKLEKLRSVKKDADEKNFGKLHLSFLKYRFGKGRKEHATLEKAHLNTKEGQLELALNEAEILNQGYARWVHYIKEQKPGSEDYEKAFKAFEQFKNFLATGTNSDINEMIQKIIKDRKNNNNRASAIASGMAVGGSDIGMAMGGGVGAATGSVAASVAAAEVAKQFAKYSFQKFK